MKIPSMVFWHGRDGQKPALLVKTTARYTFLVMLDEARGVILKRVPNEEMEVKPVRVTKIRLRPALFGGEDYQLRRGVAHYRRIGKKWGISGAATDALKDASGKV